MAPVDHGRPPVAQAVIMTGTDEDKGRYDYDIEVSNRDTGVGNIIDPELQIDN